MTGVVRIRVHQIIFSLDKMAALHEDFLFGDDLDAVLAAVEDNFTGRRCWIYFRVG